MEKWKKVYECIGETNSNGDLRTNLYGDTRIGHPSMEFGKSPKGGFVIPFQPKGWKRIRITVEEELPCCDKWNESAVTGIFINEDSQACGIGPVKCEFCPECGKKLIKG